jgi:hypothetical protein
MFRYVQNQLGIDILNWASAAHVSDEFYQHTAADPAIVGPVEKITCTRLHRTQQFAEGHKETPP